MTNDKKPKICLCAILRNEAKVVERMLESCKEIITCMAITDTGSTDNTCSIIEEWAKKNEIPCEIAHEEWINFGVSRTDSMLYARHFFPDVDFYLLLDGDMILHLDKEEGDISSLDRVVVSEYRIEQRNYGQHYYNVRLTNALLFHRSVASTHEYWGAPVRSSYKTTKTLYIEDMNDGGSRSDKHERDRRMLLEGMRKGVTPDYLLPRYAFYLSQTYQGLRKYDISNEWSHKMLELGSWGDDRYITYMRIANNNRYEGNYDEAIKYYHKALDHDPRRAEANLGLCRSLKKQNLHKAAKEMAELGIKKAMPKHALFLDVSAYQEETYKKEFLS
jgi:glycosyltransferase involved in cell wall biosynthesis